MAERRPARIFMRATPHLDASRFSLRVALDVPGVGGDSPGFRQAIDLFVAGANAGLFGGWRSPSAPSTAGVTAWGKADDAAVDIACSAIERGAVRVLANLLRRALGEPGAPLRAIVASGQDDRLAAASAIGVDALPYPLAPEHTPFDVAIESPERSLDPLNIRLGFAADLAEDALDAIDADLRVWIELVGRGGYLAPDADPAGVPDVEDAEIYLLSPSQVEAVLYGFAADDEAFDGLIGLLMRRSATSAAELVSVEVW